MIYDNDRLKINNNISICVQSSDELSDMVINSVSKLCETVYIHLNTCNYYDLRDEIYTLCFSNRNIIFLFEGIGMKSFSLLLLGKWLKDCNGTDSFPLFIDKVYDTDCKIYLLGATEEVILKSVTKLRKQYPQLSIVGFHSGYFETNQEAAIVSELNESKPDILIIGRGMEKELEFIQRNSSRIEVKNIWCVGGLFDFVSNNKQRAPIWIRKIRCEWLFRIYIEPKRFKKKLKSGIWTFSQLIKSRIKYGKSV